MIFWPLLPGSPKTLEAFSLLSSEKGSALKKNFILECFSVKLDLLHKCQTVCPRNTQWAEQHKQTTTDLWKACGESCSVYTLWVCVWAPLKVCVHVWAQQQKHAWIWMRKCGVRVLIASAVHRIYLRGSGADPAHKHSAPSQRALSRPPETQSCHSYFATHLDTLTTILCTGLPPCATPKIHSVIYCNYTGNYENISTPKMGFIRSAWRKRFQAFSHPLENLNEILKYTCFLIIIKIQSTYWFNLFLTGMDPGLAPPQMEESK